MLVPSLSHVKPLPPPLLPLPPSYKLPLPPNYHYSPHTHTFVVSSTDGTAKSATESKVNIIHTNINIAVLRYTQPIEEVIDKNDFEKKCKMCTKCTEQTLHKMNRTKWRECWTDWSNNADKSRVDEERTMAEDKH